jgi:hypothetical protein
MTKKPLSHSGHAHFWDDYFLGMAYHHEEQRHKPRYDIPVLLAQGGHGSQNALAK